MTTLPQSRPLTRHDLEALPDDGHRYELILSPSTARLDRWLKWSRYEAASAPSYWIVDPIEPALTAWELRDKQYVEVDRATGGERLAVSRPFPVEICPADLVSD